MISSSLGSPVHSLLLSQPREIQYCLFSYHDAVLDLLNFTRTGPKLTQNVVQSRREQVETTMGSWRGWGDY